MNGFISDCRLIGKMLFEFTTFSTQKFRYTSGDVLNEPNMRNLQPNTIKGKAIPAELKKWLYAPGSLTQQLTDLETEILSYDLSKRDDFFNCHKTLNTYIRLEKITQSEIKRIDNKVRKERIKKVRKEQTDEQKRRKENERRKYFLGGVVLKYSKFLKDNYLFSSEDTEEAILQHLLEDFIVCNYLSDVTNDDENKAANVKKVIKNNHSEIIQKIRNMSNEIENDKRR